MLLYLLSLHHSRLNWDGLRRPGYRWSMSDQEFRELEQRVSSGDFGNLPALIRARCRRGDHFFDSSEIYPRLPTDLLRHALGVDYVGLDSYTIWRNRCYWCRAVVYHIRARVSFNRNSGEYHDIDLEFTM